MLLPIDCISAGKLHSNFVAQSPVIKPKLPIKKDPNKEDPGLKDLYSIGTVSTILQLIKLPDGTN